MNEINRSENSVVDIVPATWYSKTNAETDGAACENPHEKPASKSYTGVTHQPDFHDSRSQNAKGFMRPDEVDLHWLWRETTNRLNVLAGLVRENKRVLEAADFARWLRFSGLPKLFKQFPQATPFCVDGDAVQKQIDDLLFECGEKFRTGKADPQYAASDIAEINRKLDIIAAHVSGATLPPVMQTPAVDTEIAQVEPALIVMQGGAS